MQTAGDVDGVVKGRGGVSIGGVVVEELEELEVFGFVVPKELEDLVHEVWGPFNRMIVNNQSG